MGTAYLKDAPPLVDLGDCHDIFLSGVARIDLLPGNCLRFVCYVEDMDGDDRKRTVALKVIWPMEVLPMVLRQAAQAMTGSGTAILADDGEFRLAH